MVGVVPVARPQYQLRGLGFQTQALAALPVVHLLLGLAVLPGPGVVSGAAPVDGDGPGAVRVRAPLARGQLALRVQPEELVPAETVATGGGDLEKKLNSFIDLLGRKSP